MILHCQGSLRTISNEFQAMDSYEILLTQKGRGEIGRHSEEERGIGRLLFESKCAITEINSEKYHVI